MGSGVVSFAQEIVFVYAQLKANGKRAGKVTPVDGELERGKLRLATEHTSRDLIHIEMPARRFDPSSRSEATPVRKHVEARGCSPSASFPCMPESNCTCLRNGSSGLRIVGKSKPLPSVVGVQ